MIKHNQPSLFSLSTTDDPYSIYEKMRKYGDIYWDDKASSWCVLCFDYVHNILNDESNFSTDHLATRAEPVLGDRVLAQMTGKEHDEKKAITMRGLAQIALDGYYLPIVREKVNHLWEGLGEFKEVDIVNKLAAPFAHDVTCQLLGIDKQWKAQIVPWNRSIVKFITLLQQPATARTKQLADAKLFRHFMLKMIEARRKAPRHDLISFLAVRGYREGVSDTEIVALALNIFLAASEPLDKTLAYSIFELLRNPDCLARVQSNKKFCEAILSEVLRLHPPVQIIPRVAVNDVKISNYRIKKGDTVYCLIGAAHRDPAKYNDPATFLPNRVEGVPRSAFTPSAKQLAFGSGVHFCIGSMLAKRQLLAALESSIPYLDQWQLVPHSLVEAGLYTRGPIRLCLEKVGA